MKIKCTYCDGNGYADADGRELPCSNCDGTGAAYGSLTPAQIGEIRERADKATEGPWHQRGTHVIDDQGRTVLCAKFDADAIFVAWARKYIPALLAHIAALEGEIAGLREAQRWVPEKENV